MHINNNNNNDNNFNGDGDGDDDDDVLKGTVESEAKEGLYRWFHYELLI